MQTYIEFTLNGKSYWADQWGTGFFWGNELGEESQDFPTLVDAQQNAIQWESGRQDRIAQEEADAEADARYRKEQQFQGCGA